MAIHFIDTICAKIVDEDVALRIDGNTVGYVSVQFVVEFPAVRKLVRGGFAALFDDCVPCCHSGIPHAPCPYDPGAGEQQCRSQPGDDFPAHCVLDSDRCRGGSA